MKKRGNGGKMKGMAKGYGKASKAKPKASKTTARRK